MNDRHLYRGKRADNGEWVEGSLVCYTQLTKIKVTTHENINILDEWIIDPETIGQCTGLRDKNGKLIFEGDIVTRIGPIYKLGSHEPIGKYKIVGTVQVEENEDEPPHWSVKAKDHLGNNSNMVLFVKPSGWHRPFHVIGNIHDNPELLEGVENE